MRPGGELPPRHRRVLDPKHRNRSAEAEPLIWCQWLAMDHGAVRIDNDEDRYLILRECHLPGEFDK
jgi:hypothetical protein